MNAGDTDFSEQKEAKVRKSSGIEELFRSICGSEFAPGCWKLLMKTLGKMLQVLGLVLLPLGMMMQLTAGVRAETGGGFTVSAMLLLMIFGAAAFGLGRIVEGYGKL
jgi:hypothetical protein